MRLELSEAYVNGISGSEPGHFDKGMSVDCLVQQQFACQTCDDFIHQMLRQCPGLSRSRAFHVVAISQCGRHSAGNKPGLIIVVGVKHSKTVCF